MSIKNGYHVLFSAGMNDLTSIKIIQVVYFNKNMYYVVVLVLYLYSTFTTFFGDVNQLITTSCT